MIRAVAVLALLLGPLSPRAMGAELHRGINLTNWFRFPASRDPAALHAYIGDRALADLRTAGFDFVRLAVDPAMVDPLLADQPALIAAIRRIQRQGLIVVVCPHPTGWHLEADPADRAALLRLWAGLSAALRSLDPARTVPEVLNEPVFPHDPGGWAALQHSVLAEIRANLPSVTVILTGQDWGSIGGLTALTPESDPNVLYSFHFYDPAELTSLAAYRRDVDRGALARLPFPATGACAVPATDAATRDLARYYCGFGWDAARIDAMIGRAAAWARAHNVRLIAGEFGATAELNASARMSWIGAVRSALEVRRVPWALWGYEDVMGFDVPRPPGRRPVLGRGLLSALGLHTPI